MSEVQDKPEKMPPVPPFVQFVTSAVPMVFDNSMSYYEALCALWKYINGMTSVINNNATLEEEYIEKFNELKEFVDTYFDNLDVQEEINNKLDEMVEDGTFQEIVGNLLVDKADYFEVTTKAELKTALADTRSSIIVIKNDLTLDEIMVANHDTLIDLGNHTLTFSDTTHGFRNYLTTDTFTAYNGNGNITIRNGKITGSGAISFCHAKNITIEDIYFENIAGAHILEMMSINGLTVKRCTLKGLAVQELNRRYVEYIQVDDCTYSNFPWFDDENNPTYDETPNKNWVIDSNELIAPTLEGYTFYTGIGSHTYVEDKPHSNINITNNLISGYNCSGITFRNFENSTIANNRFIGGVDTVDTARVPYAIKSYRIFKNITIKNNDVNLNQNGSMFYYSESFVENCNILDNTIYGAHYTPTITDSAIIYCFVPTSSFVNGNTFYDIQTRLLTVRHTDTGSGYIVFNNNDVTYTAASWGGWSIRMFGAGYIKMINNTFNYNTLSGEVLTVNEYCTKIYWKNNTIISDSAVNNHKYAIYTADYLGNYDDIYGVMFVGYSGDASSLDDQSLSYAYTNFDTMICVFGTGGNTQTFYCKDFAPRGKLSARTYRLSSAKSDGTNGVLNVTLNSDGTVDYSTSETTLKIRSINLVNE